MPIYEFECSKGHRSTQVLALRDFKEKTICIRCRVSADLAGTKVRTYAKLVPSRTGTPVLKEGNGGFYKPTRPERNPSA